MRRVKHAPEQEVVPVRNRAREQAELARSQAARPALMRPYHAAQSSLHRTCIEQCRSDTA
jgi:hypothetical protein